MVLFTPSVLPLDSGNSETECLHDTVMEGHKDTAPRSTGCSDLTCFNLDTDLRHSTVRTTTLSKWRETERELVLRSAMVILLALEGVRGTCWLLQVHSGKAPEEKHYEEEGGLQHHHMKESSYLLRGRQREASQRLVLCDMHHPTHTHTPTHAPPGWMRCSTLISGLCCCRLQTAALRPRPPEPSASHICRGEQTH